jgi:membrane protease YdiL (CAAX protease family)
MPYIAFIIIVFSVAYMIQIATILRSPKRKIDGAKMGKSSQRLLTLCMLSPTMILVVFIIIGQVPLDWYALGILPVRPGMWGLAFVVTVLYQSVVFIVLKKFAAFPDFSISDDGKWKFKGMSTVFAKTHSGSPLPYSLDILGTIIIVTILTIPMAFGEELAWRGFLQPFLIAEFGTIWGILLLGTIWGFWHLPTNLAGLNDTKNPKLTAFVFFIIGTISMSAVFGWLVLFTGSIWPAVVAHATNNVLQNFIARLEPKVGNIKYMLIMSAVYAVFGGVFFWLIHVTICPTAFA